MRYRFLLPVLAAGFTVGLALAPASVQAANAKNPYANVDRRNDSGNDTGDSKVDALNAAQLNQNYVPGTNERMMNGGQAAPMGAPGSMPGQSPMQPRMAPTRP